MKLKLLFFLILLSHYALADSSLFYNNQILVKFKNNIAASTLNNVLNTAGVSIKKNFPYTGVSILQIGNKNNTIHEVLEYLRKNNALIEYAEPDYLWQISTIPNDSQFSELWGLHNTGQMGGTVDADVDAPEAWDIYVGDSSIVVAVIDTGIDYTHPDLAANMWRNPGEIAGNGIDDDGNGYVDDIYGINVISSNDPMDNNGHGTHLAGTIGAVGDNGIGVAGINWHVQLMGVKFMDEQGKGTTSDAIAALEYVIKMKTQYGVNVKLINNSWSGWHYSQALYDAIAASEKAGILFVAAAGNYGMDNDVDPQYPASYDLANIIAVASKDHNDKLSSSIELGFSNYGATTVDLGAPGSLILSTVPGGNYATDTGTSMATPHVSGAAALLWMYQPDDTYIDIKATLINTVDPLDSLKGKVVSGGRLNLYNALTRKSQILPDKPTLISPSGSITNPTPTYTWQALPNAEAYRLQVYEAEQSTQQWYSAEEAGCANGTCAVTPNKPLSPGDVVWWVQASNQHGVGPLSDPMIFVVDTLTTPAPVTMISPTGQIAGGTPTYTWYAAKTATWYQLWINDSSGKLFAKWYTANEMGCETGICQIKPAVPLEGGEYAWWVQSWNPAGSGPWAEGMAFTVITEPPPIATLSAPNGTLNDNTLTYTWKQVKTATWYYLWINDSSGKIFTKWYTANEAGCVGFLGVICQIKPAISLEAGQYTWWIQTWNPIGYGPWSEGMTFTLKIPPPASTLQSPKGTINDASPIYIWNAVKTSTWYYLWVNNSSGKIFAKWYTSDEVGCSEDTCQVKPDVSLTSGEHTWWIQTWSPIGYGPWSEPMRFNLKENSNVIR